MIDLADEFGIPVVSPRDRRERAGIVVLEPAADQLHRAGRVAATTTASRATPRGGHRAPQRSRQHRAMRRFDMLRASFVSSPPRITV